MAGFHWGIMLGYLETTIKYVSATQENGHNQLYNKDT